MGKSGQVSVSVILPAFNEEDAVREQVGAVRDVLYSHGIEHEIVVVDDGSEDRTAEEAIRTGARVLRHPENRGYGAAIKTGILAASSDEVVIIDADGTYPADEIPHLVEKLRSADMVVGARTGRDVSIPWMRRPAKWLLGWLATRISDQSIPDLNSGLRAFRRACAEQYFPILSNRFSFTTTLTLALLADDYRVVYHPINYYARVGRSKIQPRHFMDFVVLILRMSMIFQPLRVFVPLATTFGIAGALKGIYDIVVLFQRSPVRGPAILYEPVLSTSAVLLLLVAMQLLLIGMVADGVIRRIAHQSYPLVPSHGVVDYTSSYTVELEVEEEEPVQKVK